MINPVVPTSRLALAAGIFLVSPAFAAVNIDYVTVSNANDLADSTGYDAVAFGATSPLIP